MSIENHKKTHFYKGLEKLIFDEKDFEELRLILNKLGNGGSNLELLKRKIINSRIRILEEVYDFVKFHIKKQIETNKEGNTPDLKREIQEKNKLLTFLAERIETFHHDLTSDAEDSNVTSPKAQDRA